jgi:MHS family shikimate/dehydroshikimate transporter-like MFS transporter
VLAIGTYVRLRVQESPIFTQMKDDNELSPAPVREVFRDKPARKNLFIAFGARFAEITGVNIFQVWVLSYLATWVGISSGAGLLGVQIAQGLSLLTIPFFGSLTDRIGRRPVYIGGAVAMAILVVPFFLAMNTGNTVLIVIAMTLMLAIAYQAMFAAQASYFSELFPPRLRVTGFTTARELTAAALGGTASIIATGITAATGGSFWPVAGYMALMCAVTVIAVAIGPETNRRLAGRWASRQDVSKGENA